MSIEKLLQNDTETQQFLSIYPIPTPIRLPPARGLTRAKFPGIDTEKIQKICLSIHITVAVGKEAFPCQE